MDAIDRFTLDFYDGKNIFTRLNWRNPSEFLEVARTGAFAPFSDAFRYGPNEFLVVGESDSGKTSTTGRFVRYNGRSKDRNKWCTRLGTDSSTNYFEDGKMYIYTNRKQCLSDFEPILKGDERFPLQAIFYLVSDGEETNNADTMKVLRRMFNGGDPSDRVSREVVDITYESYKNIPILTIPQQETPDKKYHEMKRHAVLLMK